MIFITAKFRVKPEHADRWHEISRSFTEATRAEPGNLWFDWSRSLDDPTEYVLVEAFPTAMPAPPTCSRTTSGPPSATSPPPRRDPADRELVGPRHRLVRARRDEGRALTRRSRHGVRRRVGAK